HEWPGGFGGISACGRSRFMRRSRLCGGVVAAPAEACQNLEFSATYYSDTVQQLQHGVIWSETDAKIAGDSAFSSPLRIISTSAAA
ncbi:hypothetical protein, partial [Sinorhizobium meliloti]|uniref:hypothetical protein n=1 Tax=Rhizobium meliloti TaxID=382 RepID=UPI001F45BE01